MTDKYADLYWYAGTVLVFDIKNNDAIADFQLFRQLFSYYDKVKIKLISIINVLNSGP